MWLLTAVFLPITLVVLNLDVLLESVQPLSSVSYENRNTSTNIIDEDHDAATLTFVHAVQSDVCVPMLLLYFFDELIQFINPVSRQPAYYHILHRLHHLASLTTLTPVDNKCIISLRHLAHTLNACLTPYKAL